MKKELFISILLGVLSIGAIGFFLLKQPSSVTSVPNQGKKALSTADVTRHANESDCWVIVDGNVYDVTTLLSTHSGGAKTIIPSCGSDATTLFATKNGKGTHSEKAETDLSSMLVGKVQ